MPHHNTVFRDLLKLVPWHRFDALVEDHNADARVRRLSTKGQFVALLYGQLSGASGLREIVTGLSSHAARLYHLGADPIRRSTMSDANAKRPFAVFSELLEAMMKQAHCGLRRKLAETTYLIDSTSVRLNEHSAGWARFSSGVCGAKVHVIYDADADRPIYAAVSASMSTTLPQPNTCRSRRARPMSSISAITIMPGGPSLMPPAAALSAGSNPTPRSMWSRTCRSPRGSNILSDRIGFLPARQARSRRNPLQDAVREVRITTETGKVLRLLSNDLDASAEDIAGLYRRRWAIELFFRWVKQTLKITRFIGTSENAVRIQIAVALIAFLSFGLQY